MIANHSSHSGLPSSSLVDNSRPLCSHSQYAARSNGPAPTRQTTQPHVWHYPYSASLAHPSVAQQQPPWSMPQPLMRDSNARVQYPHHLGFGPHHHTITSYQEWPGTMTQSNPTRFTHFYSLLTPANAFVNFRFDKDPILHDVQDTCFQF